MIGTLLLGNGQPPERNADGKNNIQVIKSRSGHRLIFDDTAGHERLILCDATRKNAIILDSATSAVTIQSMDGDIEVRAPSGTIRLHGKNVQISTTGNIQGQGGRKLKLRRGELSTFVHAGH